ncbi:DinB family protein [Terribacillus sp. 179-K 1B1 HS]|uniref:DinB family protein n=1 Tax=Terribacillus sp. 179-K 1B1 HS TaxID=3142388 RepID=UPI0039A3F41C
MKCKYMKSHFDTIYRQREKFDKQILAYKEIEWIRPMSEKWSIGETYYHLYLLLKRFRQLNKVYIPIGSIRKQKPFKTEIEDIYQAYREKHGKPMRAPSILQPPKNIEGRLEFDQLKQNLHKETVQLEKMVSK